MTDLEVFARIEALIRDVHDQFDGPVTPSCRFREDLEMDSLSTVELITAAERAFDIQIPYEDLDRFVTVDDLIGYVARAEVS